MTGSEKEKFKIILATGVYSLNDILSLPTPSGLGETELQVVEFIKAWKHTLPYVFQKTSGSTGLPKEIKIYKKHMLASAQSTVDALQLQAGDTALLNIHPDYIGGKMMIVRAIEHQMKLIVAEIKANPLMKLSSNEQIDFFSFVPYQLREILNGSENYIRLLNQSKAIIIGGAAVSNSLEAVIKNRITSPCYSTYGMTETVSHIALKRLNQPGSNSEEHFHAIKNVHFSVDKDSRLIIHAAYITGHEDLLTNDVVKLYSSTSFEWLGRYDFVINSGGIKIHAEQLEVQIGLLLQKADIRNPFFVFGKEDDKLGEQLTILIESTTPIPQLKVLLMELPKIKRPKEILYLDRFIYTKNDKLDRKASIAAAH